MTFMPFLAGKRVCAGKTFAENSMKVIIPLILKAFSKFDFVDESFYQMASLLLKLDSKKLQPILRGHHDGVQQPE